MELHMSQLRDSRLLFAPWGKSKRVFGGSRGETIKKEDYGDFLMGVIIWSPKKVHTNYQCSVLLYAYCKYSPLLLLWWCGIVIILLLFLLVILSPILIGQSTDAEKGTRTVFIT